jgi:hypothetical protein
LKKAFFKLIHTTPILGNWDENCFPTIFIIHPSVVHQWRVGAGSLCPRAREEEERTNEEEEEEDDDEEGDQQLQI